MSRLYPFLFKTYYHLKLFTVVGIVFLLLAHVTYAQQKQVDSLLNRLSRHPKQDTVYLNLLNKIAFAYALADKNKGIAIAEKAILLAQQLKVPHAEWEGWYNKGVNFRSGSEFAKAIDADRIALDGFAQLKDKSMMVQCCQNLSINYYATGAYPASLEYASKGVTIARHLGDDKLLSSLYNKQGNAYTSLGDFPKAINTYLQQLKILEKQGDKLNMAKAYGNIGLVDYYLKKFPEALSYLDKCLKVLEKLNDRVWMAAALNNIGGVYLEMKDYPKAIEYNTRALQINRAVNSAKGMGNDLMDLGVSYSHLHNYQSAFGCLQQAVTIYDTLGAKNNSAIALGYLATMYMNTPADTLAKIGIDPNTRFTRALQLQQKAVQLAGETKSLSTQADQWKNLGIIHEQQKNYREALKSYRNYSAFKDSIFNDKKREEITRLNIRYEYDKREAAIKAANARKEALASAELARQKIIKNSAIAIGLMLLISGITLFAFFKRKKDYKEKKKDAEFKAQVAETELKALRAQLNPHFIFNSLNSIGDYIARHDKDTADIYLARFAKLMRMILENSEHETISLADDLKTLELYIQLEALRLGHKFIYHIDVDAEIDAEQTMVPPMLLQPFVENSIWHGISPKSGNGMITIGVKKNGNMIEYAVEDNGIGRIKADELKKNRNGAGRRSFGIKVIQSRINIINETRQTHAKVELTDLEEGTKVSIKLPHELRF